MTKRHILILLPDLRGGGAERLHVNLANKWIGQGLKVEFALMTKQGVLLGSLDEKISVTDLRASRARWLLVRLTSYLRLTRPDFILAAIWPLTTISIVAWILAGRPGRLFVSDHCQLSISSVEDTSTPRWLIGNSIRFTYPLASGVIAVSQGVKQDMCDLGFLNPSTVQVIYNPTAVGVQMHRGGDFERESLWGKGFNHHILSVGSLKKQKDHATLLQAFALLPKSMGAKLTILGEGSLRGELEELVRSLGLEGRVAMPGFALDPYVWYQTADLFVLSSRWEGFGNVIVEALECGIPVVSTDCPSGPSEILENGRFGHLVPIQDPVALADAMARSLNEFTNREKLVLRASDFSVDVIADQYLKYFNPGLQDSRQKACL